MEQEKIVSQEYHQIWFDCLAILGIMALWRQSFSLYELFQREGESMKYEWKLIIILETCETS